MSAKDSSSPDNSFHSQFLSNWSIPPPPCTYNISGNIFIAFHFINIIFLLPLSVSVLILGFQQWKQQRSVSSAASTSFSDIFTYNMAVMELIGILGNTTSILSSFTFHVMMIWVGTFISAFPWTGQIAFPVLTCVECYVAVVHPIIYLQMKKVVRIKNISTGVVWLLCFESVVVKAVMIKHHGFDQLSNVALMALSSIGVTFCCLSVLSVLFRPRPGEVGRNRERMDQSKQRAVNIILIIMGVLLFRFGGNLACDVVTVVPGIRYEVQCVIDAFREGFNLPSSLVLPLLFLHRAGKLPGCKRTAESG